MKKNILLIGVIMALSLFTWSVSYAQEELTEENLDGMIEKLISDSSNVSEFRSPAFPYLNGSTGRDRSPSGLSERRSIPQGDCVLDLYVNGTTGRSTRLGPVGEETLSDNHIRCRECMRAQIITGYVCLYSHCLWDL